MYKEYQPHPSLIPYIEVYWMSNEYAESEIKQRILPDGCVDIIVSLDDNENSEMPRYRPYIVGTMTTFMDVYYSGKIKMLGIRFRPGAITALTRVPINEFTDRKIDFTSFSSLLDYYFYQEIQIKESTTDILSFLNYYFFQKVSGGYAVDSRITYAISLIEQANGNISIPDVAIQTCLSSRQLERRFKTSIGISAKTFSRIIRFNHTRRHFKKFDKCHLLDTAIHFGYTDHSHLLKDFKALSGLLPSGVYDI